jgi:MoaA/NifB/PqqE/SkfB family radical SAM enzyme
VNQLNLHQLRAIVDFVASQKFHILTFIPLHDYPALEVLDELALPAMEDASYYACDKGLLCNHYSRRIDKPQSTPSTVTSKIWRCPRPWQHVYVLCNGDIAPCCYLLNSLETIMGNVMCESLDQIWNSQKYQTLRHSALQGYPDFCCSEKGCRAKVSFTPNVTND